MAFLLYGTYYIQHASQVLYHTHVADLPDTHSHTLTHNYSHAT